VGVRPAAHPQAWRHPRANACTRRAPPAGKAQLCKEGTGTRRCRCFVAGPACLRLRTAYVTGRPGPSGRASVWITKCSATAVGRSFSQLAPETKPQRSYTRAPL